MDYKFGELLVENFDKPVLYNPATECNSLKIITAFTDCERISTHLITLSDGIKAGKYTKKIEVEIVLGMTKSSLSAKKHQDICRLVSYLNGTKGMPKVTCKYICTGKEVHSKCYVWSTKDDANNITPVVAYCGSLNYTMNAFYKRRESVVCCNPVEILEYFNVLENDSLECTNPEILEHLKKISNGTAEDGIPDAFEDISEDYDYYDKLEPIDTLNVSLLRADGTDTGYGSGINWGIRKNGTKRNQNQAYIPYNKADKKDGFFPDRINPEDDNCPIFKVITKDFGSFHMRMAQERNKALHSAESNAILGEWIRRKIHAPDGGYITKQMLENYGRTYVTFRKYADGVYLLDF